MPTPGANELTGARLDAPARIDSARVERFRANLALLTDPARDRVLVAVSGGPDSVALLLLTHAVLGGRCLAATVDHGLRPAAADEAVWAAQLCSTIGVSHKVLRASLPDRVGRTANLSARARDLRYRLLDAYADAIGADWIATAHHADDQVETLVMRLNRGAGVAGLAGVRRRSGQVIRPLLDWRRDELAALVAAAGITAVDDPSNRDDRFDRARLRKALAQASWLDPVGFSASARALAEVEDALGWTVARLAAERIAVTGDTVAFDPADLPPALVRRLVLECLRRIDPAAAPDGQTLSRLVAALKEGRAATVGGCVARTGTRWRFHAAPPRRNG